jgi:hypothetical protein
MLCVSESIDNSGAGTAELHILSSFYSTLKRIPSVQRDAGSLDTAASAYSAVLYSTHALRRAICNTFPRSCIRVSIWMQVETCQQTAKGLIQTLNGPVPGESFQGLTAPSVGCLRLHLGKQQSTTAGGCAAAESLCEPHARETRPAMDGKNGFPESPRVHSSHVNECLFTCIR